MSSPAHTRRDGGHGFTPLEALAAAALLVRPHGVSERPVWDLHPHGACL